MVVADQSDTEIKWRDVLSLVEILVAAIRELGADAKWASANSRDCIFTRVVRSSPELCLG